MSAPPYVLAPLRKHLTSLGTVCTVLCSLLFLLPTALVQAQVNTEVMRVGKPEPGFSGLVGANFNVQDGTVDFLEVSGNGQLNYNQGLHSLLLSSTAGYGKTEGDAFARKAFGHMRWTAMWLPRLGSEVFTQVEYDRFLRQRLRWLVGAGPRVQVIRDETFEAFWGIAYMIEREVLNIPASDPHPEHGTYHRATTYVSLKWVPTKAMSLVQTIYVQPRIDRFSDVRMLEQADLRVAVWSLLSLKTSITVRYDGRPPRGVDKTNLSLTQGFDLTF